jgi:hypothetical protein
MDVETAMSSQVCVSLVVEKVSMAPLLSTQDLSLKHHIATDVIAPAMSVQDQVLQTANHAIRTITCPILIQAIRPQTSFRKLLEHVKPRKSMEPFPLLSMSILLLHGI